MVVAVDRKIQDDISRKVPRAPGVFRHVGIRNLLIIQLRSRPDNPSPRPYLLFNDHLSQIRPESARLRQGVHDKSSQASHL